MIMEVTAPTMTRYGAARALIALTAAVGLVSGCGPEPKAFPWATPRPSASDVAFAAGVNRAPTPKTIYAMARILTAQGRDVESEHLLRRTLRESPRFLPAKPQA